MGTDNVRSSNEPRRSKNVGGKGANRLGREPFSWDNIEPDAIGRFVAFTVGAGCGLVLGRTSDGGALSVTILDGDERIREYPASVSDFDRFTAWVELAFGN